MSLLSVQNLSKSYPQAGLFSRRKQQILSDISFNLVEKLCLGLVGESGSGKSTLARLLCGLEQPDSGRILLKNGEISDKTLRQQHISVVFQDYTSSINPTMNVLEAISEPLSPFKLPKDEVRQQVLGLLQKVGLDEETLPKYIHELSGGQAQRVNICRALITRPALIIFDEAVSSLDLVTQVQILDLLLELKQAFNLSYLFITHNIQVLCYLCDRVIFLEHGRIVAQSDVAEIAQLNSDYAKRLLNSVIC